MLKTMKRLFPCCVLFLFASGLPCLAQVCTAAPCLTVSAQGWIVGEVKAFAFGYDTQVEIMKELHSKGWAECAGQSFSRTDFPQLYKAIGNTWGSADGTNVFYLPDLRGQVLRVWNHAGSQAQKAAFGGDPDVSQRSAPRPEIPPPGTNGSTGDAVGSIQGSQVGDHTHPLSGYKNNHLLLGSLGYGIDFPANAPPPYGTIGSPNEPHSETRSNNVYVMYMIYVGVPVSTDTTQLKK